MTVTAQQTIFPRPWRGYDDPGLPSASWSSWVSSPGDASAGDNFAQVIIEPEAQNLSGRYYSLEVCEAFVTGATAATPVDVILIGFGPAIAGVFTNRHLRLDLEGNQFAGSGLNLTERLSRPVFLGQKLLAASNAIISAVMDNVDAKDLTLWCEGYMWDPGANMAKGGVRRPVDSLYG